MRITNQMIIDRAVRDLTTSFSRYMELQTIVSSGRRINKPSDDPIGITKALGYRTYLNELDQFQRNIGTARTMLNYSDSSFSAINDFVIQAQDVALQLSNGTYDDNARIAASQQIGDIIKQIISTGNNSYQNKYIFAGHMTQTAPYDFNGMGVVYRGDNGDLSYEIDRNMMITANIPGSDFLLKPVTVLGDGYDLNPGLSRDTLLINLNGGNGVNLGDNHFTIETLNGTADIDLTGVVSIGDALDAINSQAASQGLSNFTVSISDAGNSFHFEDTSDPYITVNTSLSMLNSGSGVDLSIPTFTIKDGTGTEYTIDLTGAEDLGDVIDAINNAAIPGLSASITNEGNSITLNDSLGLDYTVEEDGGSVAEDLGLLTSEPINGEFVGSDLNPLMISIEESADGESTASDLGILFSTSQMVYDGDDVDPRLTYNTKLTNLRNNLGITNSLINIVNGHNSVNIDLSSLDDNPDATIKDLMDMIEGSGAQVKMRLNDDKTGVILESTVSGQSLIVYDTDENGSASQLGIAGSPDLVGSLLYLQKGLENNWVSTAQETIDRFQLAQNQILSLRSVVGSRINRLDSVDSKNLDYQVYITKLLSDVEDADMLNAVSNLANQEVVYQAALATVAKVIQPSLVNFLS